MAVVFAFDLFRVFGGLVVGYVNVISYVNVRQAQLLGSLHGGMFTREHSSMTWKNEHLNVFRCSFFHVKRDIKPLMVL